VPIHPDYSALDGSSLSCCISWPHLFPGFVRIPVQISDAALGTQQGRKRMNARVGSGRVSRTFVLASVTSAALLLWIAASASAGTLDQQQNTFNADTGVFTTQSETQTFTDGITGNLDQVDLNLLKVGTAPATVNVEIRTTSAGKPTATVLASGTIATSALGRNGAFVPVLFATPAPVTAGTQYALVVYSAGMAGNAVGWSIQGSGDPYSGGETFVSGDPLPPGANWNGFPFEDFAFKTFVVPAPPAPPTPPTPPTPPSDSPRMGSAPGSTVTGQRVAALQRCRQRAQKHNWSKERLRSCKKNARLLPV
jgi:hypothetical protein